MNMKECKEFEKHAENSGFKVMTTSISTTFPKTIIFHLKWTKDFGHSDECIVALDYMYNKFPMVVNTLHNYPYYNMKTDYSEDNR